MRISRTTIQGLAAAGAVALLATVATAQDQKMLDKAVKARQGLMTLISWESAPLFAMAKGDMPYDAAMASAHAGQLLALTKYSPMSVFVPGTSNAEMPDKTRALPAIWDETDEFVDYYMKLGEQAAVVATQAGAGVEQLRAAVADLGKACGNCHEEFRQKQ